MKPATRSHDVRAFLEEGCELQGNLSFSGVVRINGKFNGEVASEDSVIIGPTAVVEGELNVGSAIIGGCVKGQIHATHRIEIQSTAQIEGSVRAPLLVIQEGAQISGDVQIQRGAENANKNSTSKAS